MIQFTLIADDNPDLALSPLLRGARLTLDFIEAHGPIGLTPLKAMKRYFVQWAAEAFAWPFYEPEDLYYLNKVLNEQDFPPLMVLHDVLLSAKLVRHAKGAMHCTKLGKQLKSKPGELWTVLADHLLALDHAPYTRHEDSVVGNWDIFLSVINVEAHNEASKDRQSSILFGSEPEGDLHDHRLRAAFYIHVLRPLTWLGLMQEHRIGSGRERQEVFTKTPLWAAALALETDRHLENLTRH